jgi:predicted ATPase/GAF domain-containing protein
MIHISGCTLTEKVREEKTFSIYRGFLDADVHKKPFLFRLLKAAYLNPAATAQLKMECEILQEVTTEGIVRVYGIEETRDGIVLIMEDFEGVSLKVLQDGRPLNVETFLDVAVQLADTLQDLHHHDFVHRAISLQNVLVNADTGQVKLGDFEILWRMSQESELLYERDVLRDWLPYVSPEQTGRMDRAVDHRTDFYALGVVFYEMLTGQPPFRAADPLELIHSHLAQSVADLRALNEQVPPVVSDIVLKLLSKSARDRYQSGYGLKTDLETCLTQWRKVQQVAPFELAVRDVSERFRISHKLYNREEELAQLLDAFDRVSEGVTQVALVTGPAGVGKSVLVSEVRKPIVRHERYFISGKYDQYERDRPYRAVIQAFQGLVRQLLTESEARVQVWKEELLAALGPNGQVIVDIIPEVELIIGPQSPVPELGPAEAQNRFNIVFQNFVGVFTQKIHPLALFLDDLQWADAASLKLIATLATDPESRYLLLVGAYRDEEVDAAHPLTQTLKEVKEAGATVRHVALPPLDVADINQLVADTLTCQPARSEPLARLVHQKTAGNPFFVKAFLQSLYDEHMLNFVPGSGWQWDVGKISRMRATDNVIELLGRRIDRQPEPTQQALELAACLGNTFDLETLATVAEQPQEALFSDLDAALRAEIVLRSEATYRFVHDRVREAAYSLIPDEEREALHLKIGRLLLAATPEEEREDHIFDLVKHLNVGQALMTEEERVEVAHLNLVAGQKARETTAYASALRYLRAGVEALGKGGWSEQYELAFALYRGRVEAEHLNGNFEQAEALAEVVLEQARSDLERAEMYSMLIVLYTMSARYGEAIQMGRKALRLLGEDLPEEDLQTALGIELAAVQENLGGREIADLLDAREMQLAEKKGAMKVLLHIGAPAFITDYGLWMVIVVRMSNLLLRYGAVPESSYAYTGYGLLLGSLMGDYQAGYEFGQLALKSADRFNTPSLKCIACAMLGGALNPWVRSLKWIEIMQNEGYQAGLESGNLQWVGYLLNGGLANAWAQGKSLEQLLQDISRASLFGQKTRNLFVIDVQLGGQLAFANLSAQTAGKLTFQLEEVSEAQYLARCQEHQSFTALNYYRIFKAQALYLYGKAAQALECAMEVEETLASIAGMILVAERNFYMSLSLAALYPEATAGEKETYGEKLRANQEQMKGWADNCEANFLHKYLLVEAEMARLAGKGEEAMALYDQAIESAHQHKFVQNEALANELAARFWLAKGKGEFARPYLTRAYDGYRRWGAYRKVEDLEERYPQLLTQPIVVDRAIGAQIGVVAGSASALDWDTVMKASQAISGERDRSQLLEKMLGLMIENAGAQKGCLVLESKGRLRVEAVGAVDEAEARVQPSVPVESSQDVSPAIVNYVSRTQESIVLGDAVNEGMFTADTYVLENQPKSVLCMPITRQARLMGILYLENNLTTNAFTPERLETLELLSSQAAISLENAGRVRR